MEQRRREDDSLLAEENGQEEEEFQDAVDYNYFESAPPNREVNFEEMARNYFSRADEIHQTCADDEDELLDFNNILLEEDESD